VACHLLFVVGCLLSVVCCMVLWVAVVIVICGGHVWQVVVVVEKGKQQSGDMC
jgi:hypothetical protein